MTTTASANASATEPTRYDDRLAGLERENRRLRRLMAFTGVGMAILLGLAAALIVFAGRYGLPGTVADEVAAERFVLRDASGAVRGVWGTADDGAVRLILQDAAGHQRVRLNLLADGSSGIALADSGGTSRAVFALLPDASVSLVMGDREGTTRSVLGIAPDGASTLVFADGRGTTRASLGVDARGLGTFSLYERSGMLTEPPGGEADSIPVDSTAAPAATGADSVIAAPQAPAAPPAAIPTARTGRETVRAAKGGGGTAKP